MKYTEKISIDNPNDWFFILSNKVKYFSMKSFSIFHSITEIYCLIFQDNIPKFNIQFSWKPFLNITCTMGHTTWKIYQIANKPYICWGMKERIAYIFSVGQRNDCGCLKVIQQTKKYSSVGVTSYIVTMYVYCMRRTV